MFRLALALGFPHPDYLTPLLTSEQVAEWKAYYNIEPFGQRYNDMIQGNIAATVANFSMRKISKPYQWSDCIPPNPWRDQEQKRKMDPDEIKQFFLDLKDREF